MVATMLCLAGTGSAHGLAEEALLKISFEKRLAVVQASYGTVMNESEKAAVGAICADVQQQLAVYATAIESANDTEANIHAAVISRMGGLQALFSASNIDDPAYKQTIVDYSTELDGYKQSSELHAVFLRDAASLDCAASPEAFQAYVTGIRSTRIVVDEHRTILTEYISQKALPAMQGLSKHLSGAQL